MKKNEHKEESARQWKGEIKREKERGGKRRKVIKGKKNKESAREVKREKRKGEK